MKLNTKAFLFTFVIVASVPMIILFIWASVNGFGITIVNIFESVHPSGGFAIIDNLHEGFTGRIPGILINSIYTIVDSFIAGFVFVKLYNYFCDKFGEA